MLFSTLRAWQFSGTLRWLALSMNLSLDRPELVGWLQRGSRFVWEWIIFFPLYFSFSLLIPWFIVRPRQTSCESCLHPSWADRLPFCWSRRDCWSFDWMGVVIWTSQTFIWNWKQGNLLRLIYCCSWELAFCLLIRRGWETSPLGCFFGGAVFVWFWRFTRSNGWVVMVERGVIRQIIF